MKFFQNHPVFERFQAGIRGRYRAFEGNHKKPGRQSDSYFESSEFVGCAGDHELLARVERKREERKEQGRKMEREKRVPWRHLGHGLRDFLHSLGLGLLRALGFFLAPRRRHELLHESV